MARTSEKCLTQLLTITLCIVFTVSISFAEENKNPQITAPGARLTKIAEGFRYTEGPAWGPDGNLYFTDKSTSRILKWSPENGVSDFRIDPGGANGLIFTGTGDMIVCESTSRRVISIAPDGAETVLANSYEGRKLNSPNDAWVDGKGGIYFSDHSMRSKEILEQKGDHIYYISPDRTKIIKVTDDLQYPNGMITNPGGDRLYVTDSGAKKTYVCTVNPDGTLKDKKVFAEEGYDGLAMDVNGNVYITPITNMVSVYDPEGRRIGEIPMPSRPANICFGGTDMQTLFLTCGSTVYSIKMNIKGF